LFNISKFARRFFDMNMKVGFLGMGGTIAGTAVSASDNVGYTAGQVPLAVLLSGIPGLDAALNGCEFFCHQIVQVDSKDLEFSHWALLAQEVVVLLGRPDIRGVVIAHGTDTLEETAYFLSKVIPRLTVSWKPVVLTCAMRPASSTSPDGPQNIVDATTVASFVGARGVLVVCAGTVHAARSIQKVHTYRLDPFDSGDAGPVGYVENGGVRLVNCWPDEFQPALVDFFPTTLATTWPRVEIVMSCVGVTGAMVRAICSDTGGGQAVQGIVVAGTGNATVHFELERALELAEKNGVRVVRTSRCAYGSVVMKSKVDNDSTAFVSVSPVKSRIDLVLQLIMEKKAD
jgi:L-asparaginase